MSWISHEYMQNRELSWLRFNERVLEEARDPSVPLGERLKFVTIFTSNLDEFFMIRVGSLSDMLLMGDDSRDNKSGMTAGQQLERIYQRVAGLYRLKDETYAGINGELAAFGLYELQPGQAQGKEQKYLKTYFREQILPLLSPQIVDGNHPFPHLQNKEIYVIAGLRLKDKKMLGVVPVPGFVPPVIFLPGDAGRYVRAETLIMQHLEMVFEQYEVAEKNYICVTRNADITPDDDSYDADGYDVDDDFRARMKKLLKGRRRMAVVRLECAFPPEERLEEALRRRCGVEREQIFVTSSPMKMGYTYSLLDKIPEQRRPALLYPPFTPQRTVRGAGGFLRQARQHDVLLHYPFESMEPFLQLIREAAYDPAVLTIKITIYRLASKARLVEYLCAAAENGKEVTVLIELRARFDEQSNIDWSERLEEAGCRVLYGFKDFKVHSKICLITLRGKNGISHITQIGTGNYNEKTAALYTDLSLITADPEIGADAAEFFKNMQVGNLEGNYRHLLVAPAHLKRPLMALIDEQARKGEKGRIVMKMNSITDYDIMEKLAEASRAGVRIDLIVRGICCILPGLEGQTDNIRVTSIVGRFLEHSRVFCFGEGAERRIFIGSADMMTRNTERRVEIACPVYDPAIKARIEGMLDIWLRDNVKARRLQPDGTYVHLPCGEEELSAQKTFMDLAEEAARSLPPEKPRQGRLLRVFRGPFFRREGQEK